MDNQKFNLILDKLLERTKENKLEWKATANADTFLVVLKDSSVSVQYGHDEYEIGEGYLFDFRDENGNIFATVIVTEKDESKKEFETAHKLFDLARKSSFWNNKTVDSILEQLAA